MKLNNDNYYVDKEYMNFSTLKIYGECDSKALATSKGTYSQNFSSIALQVGSYVDAAIEGTLEEFILHNQSIYKRGNPDNGLKKEFIDADKMIEKILNDKFAKATLKGDKQTILIGEIEGLKVKCKIDNINHEKEFFTDLKTCRDIYETMYNVETRKREHFIQNRKYIHQLAYYREIIRQNYDKEYLAWICAYDKTKDLRGLVVNISSEDLDEALEEIKAMIRKHKRIIETGKAERCEKCDYCNSTRKESRVFKDYNDLLFELGL